MAVTLDVSPEIPATVDAGMSKSIPEVLYATSMLTMIPVFGAVLSESDKVLAKEIFGNFLPAALEAGRIKTAPQAHIVGHGIEHLQAAVDRLRKGVSGSKLVVML